jgi:hypothetical protein
MTPDTVLFFSIAYPLGTSFQITANAASWCYQTCSNWCQETFTAALIFYLSGGHLYDFLVDDVSMEAVASKDGFDPRPAEQPCFPHELLECLLQCSASVESAWADALATSKERAQLMTKLNEEGPCASLFRVTIRGDFFGYDRPSTASASEGIDALIQNPSWLVPVPKVAAESKDSWKQNYEHAYNPAKTEDDLSNSFGVDIRSGTVRDWNEELQSAREMPTLVLQ